MGAPHALSLTLSGHKIDHIRLPRGVAMMEATDDEVSEARHPAGLLRSATAPGSGENVRLQALRDMFLVISPAGTASRLHGLQQS